MHPVELGREGLVGRGERLDLADDATVDVDRDGRGVGGPVQDEAGHDLPPFLASTDSASKSIPRVAAILWIRSLALRMSSG